LCFYEPFHEILARCTARKVRRDHARSWNSRHPPLSRPYRDEYLPVLRMAGLRGVRGYREEFAVAHYFASEGDIAPQVDYLHTLVRQAHRSGKHPVFGFSRSLARLGAIKRAMGGWHVVIRRNPLQQWLSCRSYRVREGAVYFEVCHFLILALAPPQSPAGRYARSLGLPRPHSGSFREQFSFMQRALWPWDDELSFRAFMGVAHLSHTAAICAADLTIDIDRLSNEAPYRSHVRTAIFANTGLATRFEDCHIGTHGTAGIELDFMGVSHDILQSLRACGAKVLDEHELSSELTLRRSARVSSSS
jgi:hypothetical protein